MTTITINNSVIVKPRRRAVDFIYATRVRKQLVAIVTVETQKIPASTPYNVFRKRCKQKLHTKQHKGEREKS
jgi:hypothetical protein